MAHVQALADAFTKYNPNMVWLFEDIGSDASMKLAAAGDIDVGFISRDPKAGEVGPVEVMKIGAAGTALAVNSSNPVKNLSREQLRQIFAGEITDWAQVGGTPGKIKVLVREKEASTRSTFESYAFDGKAAYSPDAIEVYGIDETVKSLQSFANAIGMVTLSDKTLQTPSIHLLALDGVAADRSNLNSGTYPIQRPLYLAWSADPTKLKPAIKDFIDFAKGSEGQQILAGF
jgi:phosphate transport system substrate-binding protein